MMQAECPHCNTVFRVSESQLEQANGQVRCGHCLAIFTADNPYSTLSMLSEDLTGNNASEEDEEDSLDTEKNLFSENENIVADVIPPELRAETLQEKSRFGFLGTLVLTLLILISISGLF